MMRHSNASPQLTIGILGGFSWESTSLYYKLINEAVRDAEGGLNSARMLIYSLNYAPIVELENQSKWDEVAAILVDAAQTLENAGAGFVLLACNTLHKVAGEIERAISIPFLHIADSVGEAAQKIGAKRVGLLGTQVTMEEDFYRARLLSNFDINVVTPKLADRKRLNDVIYQELCCGKVLASSRAQIDAMIAGLVAEGAQAIVLGCTELGMIVPTHAITAVPAFDTTVLHANAAVHLRSRQ